MVSYFGGELCVRPASTDKQQRQGYRTVEIFEEVPFQKNIEKRLIFCAENNILASFEPVVGDFYELFSGQGFFDSLVGLYK